MKLDSNALNYNSSSSFHSIISKRALPLLKLKLYTIHKNDVAKIISSSDSSISSAHIMIPHLELDWNILNTCRSGHLFDLPLQLKYILPRYYVDDTNTTTDTAATKTKCRSQTEIVFATGMKNISSTATSIQQYYHYKFQALFTRYISQFSIFSTGIQMDSFQGLSWLFKWQRGDVCINIPIQLSSIILGGSGSYSNSTVEKILYCVSSTYIGFLSFAIDSIVGDLVRRSIHQINGSTTNSSDESKNGKGKEGENLTSSLSIEKEKKDAESQMQLMKRKAIINKKNEEEKGGLVIVEAVYGVEGGESMDVSIQLQFWVSDSRLLLTSNSKSHMLGFYDVTKGSQITSTSSVSDDATNDKKTIPILHLYGLSALWDSWRSDDNKNSKKENQVAFLMIRYEFNGTLYEICVLDNEAISLPSPRAKTYCALLRNVSARKSICGNVNICLTGRPAALDKS